MTRSALVIHSDQQQLRFACDALVMFNPGYRVSTAMDLHVASEWLELLAPDLVVLEASIADPDVVCSWATRHSLDPDQTILFGRSSPSVSDLATASLGTETIDAPIKLPELMSAVRAIANRSTAYNPVVIGTNEPGRR